MRFPTYVNDDDCYTETVNLEVQLTEIEAERLRAILKAASQGPFTHAERAIAMRLIDALDYAPRG